MEAEERQFLLTAAWLFARHGQAARARTLCAALVEENPRDGIAGAALAEFQLQGGEPDAALRTLSSARMTKTLDRVAALLEARALKAVGRESAAVRRWHRYLNAAKGKGRTWA